MNTQYWIVNNTKRKSCHSGDRIFALAEAVGFEPTSHLRDYLISSLALHGIFLPLRGSFRMICPHSKTSRHTAFRTFWPVLTQRKYQAARVQIKLRSCQKADCSCTFARTSARKNVLRHGLRTSFRTDFWKEPSMKIDYNEFKNYPEIMNKEQLRIACHISKHTALYLLRSGLIPNETTGKKTRCYRIRKSDVIAFLKDRETNPT